MSVLQMAGAIARGMLQAFFVNYIFIVLYIAVILFIRTQYQKYAQQQDDVYGKPGRSLREVTEELILTGLLAGFVAGFLTLAAGITLEADAIRYLFYLMCILLLIDLRFVDISYAAGILGGISLIFHAPKVSVPSLLALVAILQIAESILIYISRRRDHIPVFIRHREEITGAYLIRRFWLIPIVFFTYLLSQGTGLFQVSAGWPMLFNPRIVRDGLPALGLDCLVAVLYYSDIAITKHPERISARSAFQLFFSGAVLMLLAIGALRFAWMAIPGVLLSILGHAGIQFYSRFTEHRGEPLYSAVKRGLRVMDVLPESHAQRMGLMRGDIILSINNRDIQTEEGVAEALREFPAFTWIQVMGWDGKERTVEYRCYPGGYNLLGIVSVPREKEVTYNTGYFEHMSILKNIVNRFRGADRSV